MRDGNGGPRDGCDAERVSRAEAEAGLRELGFTAEEAADLVHALQEIEARCNDAAEQD